MRYEIQISIIYENFYFYEYSILQLIFFNLSLNMY